jgi:hypothetical protein
MNHSLAHVAGSKLHSWQQGLHFNRERSSRPCGGSGGAELLPQRLQRLRLDPEYMKVCYPSVYEELKRVCASCKFQRICAQDLAAGDVQSGMRIYCPNAPVIDAMTVNWLA